jgi:hypothetical protein
MKVVGADTFGRTKLDSGRSYEVELKDTSQDQSENEVKVS